MDDCLIVRFLDGDSVNIDEFSVFLKNTSKFIKSIHEELDKETKVETQITAIEKGSFIVYMKPIIDVVGATIPILPPAINGAKDLIDSIKDVIKVIKFLEGKEPKEMTLTSITNYYGNVTNIENSTLYMLEKQESKVLDNLGNMINSAPKNKNMEFYSNYNDADRIEIKENERRYFKNQNEQSEEDFRKTDCRTKVTVKKPSLDMKSKWTVYFDKVIDVSIKDEEFSNKVKSGELSFKNGSELEVDLVVYHPVDDNSKLKPDYEIIKVYNV